MRALWLVLLILSAIPLAGCEAMGAMFSVALWVPGLFLVVLIFLVAFFAIRVRRRG